MDKYESWLRTVLFDSSSQGTGPVMPCFLAHEPKRYALCSKAFVCMPAVFKRYPAVFKRYPAGFKRYVAVIVAFSMHAQVAMAMSCLSPMVSHNTMACVI